MAAVEAERYGDWAIAPSAASPISTVGACTNTSARFTTAPAASEQIMTMRRSKRSPSMPANGAARPYVPITASSAAEPQMAEWVRPKTSAMSATKATSPPATESMRPIERRWTAVLYGVVLCISRTLRTGSTETPAVAGTSAHEGAQSVVLVRRAGSDRTHRYAGPQGRGSWRGFGRHAHIQASFGAGAQNSRPLISG